MVAYKPLCTLFVPHGHLELHARKQTHNHYTIARSHTDISTPHPPPAVVSVTATPAVDDDSVIIAGSTLTLTCTIELIEAVDDATVTVNTVWSGPTGTQFTTTTSLATRIANTTYTSRATLSSVGTSDSGEYTCTAKLSSTSPSVIESEEVSGTVVLGIILLCKFQ